MATFDELTLSHYVNEAGAYLVSISAIPEEHLHRPLIVHVGDETVLDESTGPKEHRLVRLVRGGQVAGLSAP